MYRNLLLSTAAFRRKQKNIFYQSAKDNIGTAFTDSVENRQEENRQYNNYITAVTNA
jgi:hypothetical protein